MKMQLKPKRGAALLFTIFAATFIMFTAVILMNLYMNEIRIKSASEENIQCKYIAEAGIEHGIGEINEILSLNLTLNSDSIKNLINSENKFQVDINIQEGTIGNLGKINGDYGIGFYDNANNHVDKITFEAVNISLLNQTPVYRINSVNPLELIIKSEGRLKNSSGDILKNTTIEARVKFQIDYSEKKVTKVMILDWN